MRKLQASQEMVNEVERIEKLVNEINTMIFEIDKKYNLINRVLKILETTNEYVAIEDSLIKEIQKIYQNEYFIDEKLKIIEILQHMFLSDIYYGVESLYTIDGKVALNRFMEYTEIEDEEDEQYQMDNYIEILDTMEMKVLKEIKNKIEIYEDDFIRELEEIEKRF